MPCLLSRPPRGLFNPLAVLSLAAAILWFAACIAFADPCETCGGKKVVGTGPVKTVCPGCEGTGEGLPASVSAEPEHPGRRQAVVRIRCADGSKASCGSGVVLDGGLVLTAWHVVDEGDDITVKFPDGSVSRCKVVAKDVPFDLAVLKPDECRGVPMRVAESPPGVGDRLMLAGHGPMPGEYREAEGDVDGLWKPVGRHPSDRVSMGVGAREGDSGGPVFNDKDEVAAVVSTSNGRRTWGSHSGRIRRLLSAPPENQSSAKPAPAKSQCPGGQCKKR